jgi:electron transfer flavoprotein alpha subunit
MSQDIYVVIEHLQGQVADISYVMLAAARGLAKGSGGDVVALLLGQNAQALASDLAAGRVLYLDHPELKEFTSDAYLTAIEGVIREEGPRAILFGHSSIGMDVACGLSVRLNLPLVSQVNNFLVDGGALKFISQICGGKIMAEGVLDEPTALVTMIPGEYKPEEGKSEQTPEISQGTVPALDGLRVRLMNYIEPETGDVDISNESVLIAIGRGIQTEDNIELADELAEILGGAVCSSRPIVDQGWLPISRMVGKSGKNVKPKVYVALGISGAPEHIEGISDSGVIIAVNTDATAPIFDIAQYGAEVDAIDLLEELIDQAEEAKGG